MSRLAVLLCLLTACAAPQDTQGSTLGPPSSTPPAAAEPGDDEAACTEEAPTGSLVRRTVCRSQDQMDREREEGQEFQRKAGRAPQRKIRD